MGKTTVHDAAKEGCIEVMRKILGMGYDPMQSQVANEDVKRILHMDVSYPARKCSHRGHSRHSTDQIAVRSNRGSPTPIWTADANLADGRFYAVKGYNARHQPQTDLQLVASTMTEGWW